MRPIRSTLVGCVTLVSCLALSGALHAQKMEDSERGCFVVNTLETPWDNTTYKGIIVKLGKDADAAVCFDTELLRMSAGWLKRRPGDPPEPEPVKPDTHPATGASTNPATGASTKPTTKPEQLPPLTLVGWQGLIDARKATTFTASHGTPPRAIGRNVFLTRQSPGWGGGAGGADLDDPRKPAPYDDKLFIGPVPKDWAHWKGLYRHGDQVIFAYTVGQTEVLETPGFVRSGDGVAFTRTFHVGASDRPMTLVACDVGPGSRAMKSDDGLLSVVRKDKDVETKTGVGLVQSPPGATLSERGGRVLLVISPHKDPCIFKLVIVGGPSESAAALMQQAAVQQVADPATLTKGGPALWGKPIEKRGVLSTSTTPDGAYTVDTLTAPMDNPWKAFVRFGGFDFFADGKSAAISTIGGDVWVVTGIDDKLDHLKWKRFATGLFQPLGLKIVHDTIYTVGRDQLTKLIDLNGDGEADFYENFNNDTQVTTNYHEFCLDLQTDKDGNFYYAKGSPWPPNVKSRDEGTMIKVSKDGGKLENIATGLRAPNGSGMSEDGILVASDNQGHWEPACKVSWIRPGKFYGMVPAAHLPPDAPAPTDFEQPIFWLPMSKDNSAGGEAFAPHNGKWGPLDGHMVHLSYGMSSLFACMTETVDGVMQGAAVQFPLKFDSSCMRARFNDGPVGDGQLYICGLKGWQTNAGKDGAFHRVRYTGKAPTLPTEFHVLKNGIEIGFAVPLDKESAEDAGGWAVEQWNYKWTKTYGSPEFSVADPNKAAHDDLDVKSAHLSPDGKAVFLQIEGLGPVMQMKVSCDLKSADGATMKWDIFNTIHKLGPERKVAAEKDGAKEKKED